jgi:hypothetical protein
MTRMLPKSLQTDALVVAISLACAALSGQNAPPQVNADSALLQDFQKRLGTYMQLRKDVESRMAKLKATPEQEKINRHEDELRRAIHEARKTTGQGGIFTPEVSAEFRRLVAQSMDSGAKAHIGQSLKHAEPVNLKLHANERYPEHLPLQSMPPSLLQNLPRLPAEIEYRITGRDLILLDVKASLVVDVLPDVFA